MGASIQDIAVTIISNGKKAYYSSYKGFGNIMWELDFGLYGDTKPNADTIFEFAEKTIWQDGIDCLEEPLKNPCYGELIVNFDDKTIIDDNGYGPWHRMFLEWFVNCIFSASTKYKGFRSDVIVTKKSIIYHLKQGNLYVENKFRQPSDLILPTNIDKACEVFIDLGYEEIGSYPIAPIEKGYAWGSIKLPAGWSVIKNKE